MIFAHWAHFIYNDMVHIGSTHAFSTGSVIPSSKHIRELYETLFLDNHPVPLPCCSSDVQHPECYPINVAVDDEQYSGSYQLSTLSDDSVFRFCHMSIVCANDNSTARKLCTRHTRTRQSGDIVSRR